MRDENRRRAALLAGLGCLNGAHALRLAHPSARTPLVNPVLVPPTPRALLLSNDLKENSIRHRALLARAPPPRRAAGGRAQFAASRPAAARRDARKKPERNMTNKWPKVEYGGRLPTLDELPWFPRGFLRDFVPAVAFFLIVRQLIVEPYYIPSLSMYPTLITNDNVAVEKFSKFLGPPQRGDLVVFRPPPKYYTASSAGAAAAASGGGPSLIKRVVGVGGDRLEVKDGILLRDGKPIDEPYVRELLKYQLAPFVVPPGELFVLGDNRNQSVDSHVWGSVPVANVVGKAFYVLWPVNRQGFVDELMQNLEVTRDATAFVEEVTEVTERKLEDLGFTKGGDEGGLRLKQLQKDPKTGRFSWYSTVGEPPKPPPTASVFPPSAALP